MADQNYGLLAMQNFQQLANQQNRYMGGIFGGMVNTPISFPPPEPQKKPSKRGYIARLRDEIDEWHGDILA